MEADLYDLLGVSKTASKGEIRKAYHKAALSSHPDKVPEHERETAEVRFKLVSQAHEILIDEEKRELYDSHGMAAFDKSSGVGQGPDLDEMFENLFNGGGSFPFASAFGGAPFPGSAAGGRGFYFDGEEMGGAGQGRGNKRRKGPAEEQEYEVTLEDLYKGKTTKFASTKKVICSQCSGKGGKEKAKPTQCATCQGTGTIRTISQVGQFMTQQPRPCTKCNASGEVFKEKDKCKKCKGQRTISQKKFLELYIPPGSRDGEKVTLTNEADQHPDYSEPGDLVFTLQQEPHEVFTRKGDDLCAEVLISLAEALTGLDRVVVTHLDGRGISIKVQQPHGRILRPGQVLKVNGEGMPIKKTDHRGDLYLVIKVEFPKDGWLKDEKVANTLRRTLPDSQPSIRADVVDEVEFEDGDLDRFGGEEAEEEWEDEDAAEGPQCATQ